MADDDICQLLTSIHQDIAELSSRMIAVEQRVINVAIDVGNLNRRFAGLEVHLDEIHNLIEHKEG